MFIGSNWKSAPTSQELNGEVDLVQASISFEELKEVDTAPVVEEIDATK